MGTGLLVRQGFVRIEEREIMLLFFNMFSESES
jgi:hypothetical protein